MAELRELKADIYELNRSLDASSSIPGTGGLVGSIATGNLQASLAFPAAFGGLAQRRRRNPPARSVTRTKMSKRDG